jgi:hypothetical protein
MPIASAEQTLHIALTVLPKANSTHYVNQLKKNYYQSFNNDRLVYNKGTDTKTGASKDLLYSPVVYYLFGSYDLAFISLIDNYKFAQKLLMPKLSPDAADDSQHFDTNAFQVISGTCPEITKTKEGKNFDVSDFFEGIYYDNTKDNDDAAKEKLKHYGMIAICNLKLNNKLIIGNGTHFLETVYVKIDGLLKSIEGTDGANEKKENFKYFIQRTYSWFEISVLVFTDKITNIEKMFSSLRSLKLKDSPEKREELFNNSLYPVIPKVTKNGHTMNSSSHCEYIFADTHSYIGLNSDSLKDEAAIKHLIANNPKFATQIEWQTKPGLLPRLVDRFTGKSGNSESVHIFSSDPSYMLTGKSDYYFKQIIEGSLENNINLFNILRQDNDAIFKPIRKVKTRLLIEHKVPDEEVPYDTTARDLLKQNLAANEESVRSSLMELKEMKVSRQIRDKIAKIFYNYNNEIQDAVLFPYFLDFFYFIGHLGKLIKSNYDDFVSTFEAKEAAKNNDLTINELEKKLVKYIHIFEEGYNVRLLNCYQYEDICDFDLDYNASTQQLLSAYTVIANHVANSFYSKNSFCPVVQINIKNTTSNIEAINYDIYHLACPEFVFITLAKEVLNSYTAFSKPIKNIPELKSIIQQLNTAINTDERFAYLGKKTVDLEYYFIDAINYVYTFNMDFPLYEYGFWTYNLQNTALYNMSGQMNELCFKQELFRVLFLKKMFDIDDPINCPTAELTTYWERHINQLSELVEKIFELTGRFKDDLVNFRRYIYETCKKFITSEPLPKGTPLPDIDEKHGTIIDKFVFSLKEHSSTEGKTPDDMADLLNPFMAWITDIRNFGAEESDNMKSLKLGIPIIHLSHKNEAWLLNKLMYLFLRFSYIQNKQTVGLLRRNWRTGEPIKYFIENDPVDRLYYIDPMGGLFFVSSEKSGQYFRARNAIIETTWHYAQLFKKDIYFPKEES